MEECSRGTGAALPRPTDKDAPCHRAKTVYTALLRPSSGQGRILCRPHPYGQVIFLNKRFGHDARAKARRHAKPPVSPAGWESMTGAAAGAVVPGARPAGRESRRGSVCPTGSRVCAKPADPPCRPVSEAASLSEPSLTAAESILLRFLAAGLLTAASYGVFRQIPPH